MRYNCLEKKTSAASYVFDHNPIMSTRGERCDIPTNPAIAQKLMKFEGSPPVNILMCGDSHLKELFQSIGCLFKHYLKRYLVYDLFKKKSVWLSEKDKLKHLHMLDPFNFHAENYFPYPLYNYSRQYRIGQSGLFQRADYKFGINLWYGYMRYHNVSEDTWIPNKYRNLPGLCYFNAMKQLQNETGLPFKKLQNYFQVIILNDFMAKNGKAAKDTLEMFIEKNFDGRVIFIPKFNTGYYSMEGPNPIRINKVSLDSVSSLYNYISGFKNPRAKFRLNVLNTFELLTSRDADSKSNIYPFVHPTQTKSGEVGLEVCVLYHEAHNVTRDYICLPDEFEKNGACEPLKDYGFCSNTWHIYTDKAAAAGIGMEAEQHICIPGPLDEVVRMLFASFIAKDI
jgi:hypothetical protein